MKSAIYSCVMLAVLAFAGCATSEGHYTVYSGHPDQVTPAAVAAINAHHPDNVLCWKEKPVGSHLLETYCATKEEVAAQKKRDRDQYNEMVNNSPRFCKSGAGC